MYFILLGRNSFLLPVSLQFPGLDMRHQQGKVQPVNKLHVHLINLRECMCVPRVLVDWSREAAHSSGLELLLLHRLFRLNFEKVNLGFQRQWCIINAALSRCLLPNKPRARSWGKSLGMWTLSESPSPNFSQTFAGSFPVDYNEILLSILPSFLSQA